MEAKLKMTELFPLKVYQFILTVAQSWSRKSNYDNSENLFILNNTNFVEGSISHVNAL